MDDTHPLLILAAVMALIALGTSGLFWLQATMAERGRRANPDFVEGEAHERELEAEARGAVAVARVVAPLSAVVLVVLVLVIVA